MGLFGQLGRSFTGALGGHGGGAPLDPTRPGDTPLDAWARYTRYDAPVDAPTVSGRHTGPCGDGVSFTLGIDGDRIARIGIEVWGCRFTRAAANVVASRIEGRTLDRALHLSVDQVRQAVPQLGEDHVHCAMISMIALHKALALHSLRVTGHL